MAIESRCRRTAALWIVMHFLAWAESGPVHAAIIDFESAPTGSFAAYTEAGVTFSATMELYPPLAEPHFLGVALGGSAGIAPTGSQGMLPVPISERLTWVAWDDSLRTLYPTVRALIDGEALSVSVDVGNYPPMVSAAGCDTPRGIYGELEFFVRAYDSADRLIGHATHNVACPAYLVAGDRFVTTLSIGTDDIAAMTGGVGPQTISHVLIGADTELFCPVSLFPPLCRPGDKVQLPWVGVWTDNFVFAAPAVDIPPGTVPEPGSWSLVLAALASVGMSCRLKRKRR